MTAGDVIILVVVLAWLAGAVWAMLVRRRSWAGRPELGRRPMDEGVSSPSGSPLPGFGRWYLCSTDEQLY